MQRTKVDENGRILLPAPIRRALGLRQGAELLLTLEEEGRVVLATPANAWTRVQALFDGQARPSVVDELLAERLAEARREGDDDPVHDQLGA